MDIENVVVQFELNDNVVYVIQRKRFQNHTLKTEYIFSFGTLSGNSKSTNSTHKTISGAMKKFNKAVEALNNGTNIR